MLIAKVFKNNFVSLRLCEHLRNQCLQFCLWSIRKSPWFGLFPLFALGTRQFRATDLTTTERLHLCSLACRNASALGVHILTRKIKLSCCTVAFCPSSPLFSTWYSFAGGNFTEVYRKMATIPTASTVMNTLFTTVVCHLNGFMYMHEVKLSQ